MKSFWSKLKSFFSPTKPTLPLGLQLDGHVLPSAKFEKIVGGVTMSQIRFLVIHYTEGATALSSINYWRQLSNGVCAHFVIDRDGTIYQVRAANKTAGHAGRSKWFDPKTKEDIDGLNSCSIGIELANGGSAFPDQFSSLQPLPARHKHGGAIKRWETYPEAQIKACERLCFTLAKNYSIHDIVGHDDVSPDRKTDPGPAFPMARLRLYCGFHKQVKD